MCFLGALPGIHPPTSSQASPGRWLRKATPDARIVGIATACRKGALLRHSPLVTPRKDLPLLLPPVMA